MRRAWLIPAVLVVLIVIGYAAPFSSKFFISGIMTYWTKTDTTLAVNVDTLGLWSASHRIIDSLITARASGTDQRDIEYEIYGAKNFAEGTYDTLWMQTGNNTAIYTRPQNLPSRLDRFAIQTQWDGGESAYGPDTWTDLPPISTDSALLFAVVRLNTTTNGEYRLVTLKRAVTKGFDFNRVTKGGNVVVGYEGMDNTKFPDSATGSGKSTFINGRVRMKYP